MRISALFSLALLLSFAAIDASEFDSGDSVEDQNDECPNFLTFPLPNKLSVGPEIYHLERIRKGGTKQSGYLYGVRASYDRIKRYRLYWGVNGSYAKGTLHGHNGAGDRLKSTFTDEQIEGRIGYTFQGKCLYQPALTPFLGYGYFKDSNKFHEPSPLTLRFDTTYRYFAYGFLSSISPVDDFSIGLNFKGWSMIHARTKVKDDPEEDDVTMLMGDRFNYRIELPISYRWDFCEQELEVGLVPFYELRHYGSRENYPFDYFDTKFKLWGFNFQFTYRI